jgi:hypothetical protein
MKNITITRRAFIVSSAATIALTATRAHAFYGEGIFKGESGPAFAPWHEWSPELPTEPLSPVHAAILAANPHNTQPWIFHVSDSRIDLFADMSRNIGSFDPFFREMHVGLGCAIENLALAAPVNGYECKIELLPGAANQVAAIDLTAASHTHPGLAAAITKRHTNRGPYDNSSPVGMPTLDSIGALAGDDAQMRIVWFKSAPDRGAFGDATVAATQAIVADDDQSRASFKWMRRTYDEVQRYRDGLTPLTQPESRFTIAISQLVPTSRGLVDKFWVAETRDSQVPTASAFGMIVVPDSRSNLFRLRAGRLWQRMHLWGVQSGVAMQPMNQIIERAEREQNANLEPVFTRRTAALIGDARWQPVMAFRLGYPTEDAKPSARRDVASVVVSE